MAISAQAAHQARQALTQGSSQTLNTPAQQRHAAPTAPIRASEQIQSRLPVSSASMSRAIPSQPSQTRVSTSRLTANLQNVQTEKLNALKNEFVSVGTMVETLRWRLANAAQSLSADISREIVSRVQAENNRIYAEFTEGRDTLEQVIFVYEDVLKNWKTNILPSLTRQVQDLVKSKAQQASQSSRMDFDASGGTAVTVTIDDDAQENKNLPPFRRSTIPFAPASETAGSFNFRKPLFSVPQAPTAPAQAVSNNAQFKEQLEDLYDEVSRLYSKIQQSVSSSQIQTHKTSILSLIEQTQKALK